MTRFALCLVLLGCGDSTSSPAAAAADDDAVTADAPVAADTPAPKEDTPPACTVPGPPLQDGNRRISYISVDSYHSLDQANSTAIAGFYDQIPQAGSSTSATDGACTVEIVTFGDTSFDIKYHHAGKLTVAGGAFPVALANGPGGYVAFQEGEKALFQGGEALTIAAQGGDIPAFEATVTAPSHVVVTAPVLPLGSALAVPRDKDLTLAWTGQSAGEIVFRIAGPQVLPAPQTFVTCRFDGSAASGVVPASALGQIALTGTGTISAEATSTALVEACQWGTVTVTATARTLKPSKTPYLGTLDIQ